MLARRARSVLAPLALAAGSAAVAACGPSPDPAAPATTSVDLGVTNALDVPIRLTSDDGVLGAVGPQGTVRVLVPAGRLTVTWTPMKRTSAVGVPIADDLVGGSLGVGGQRMTATITNVVGGAIFVSPIITNASGRRIGIALADFGGVRCLGVQEPADSLGTPVAWGYYRLTGATTLRAYPTADCTGEGWVFWSTVALAGFSPNTGVVPLRLDGFPALRGGSPRSDCPLCFLTAEDAENAEDNINNDVSSC